jgi:hypothetical protein
MGEHDRIDALDRGVKRSRLGEVGDHDLPPGTPLQLPGPSNPRPDPVT